MADEQLVSRPSAELLAHFYELILVDVGTGLGGPLARLALRHADLVVMVCTSEWVTTDRVLEALRDLDGTVPADRIVVVLNQAPARAGVDRQLLEAAFHRAGIEQLVAVPADGRLHALLDAGAYDPARLPRATRIAVKQLGLAVGERLA